MRLIILLAVTSCFLTSTSVSASECFDDVRYPTGAPLPIAIVDNRVWLGNHESERDAIGAARRTVYVLRTMVSKLTKLIH